MGEVPLFPPVLGILDPPKPHPLNGGNFRRDLSNADGAVGSDGPASRSPFTPDLAGGCMPPGLVSFTPDLDGTSWRKSGAAGSTPKSRSFC